MMSKRTLREEVSLGYHAAAVGAAQIVIEDPDEVAVRRSHHRASLVKLGNETLAFRFGNEARERANAVDDVAYMLRRMKLRGGRVRVRLDFKTIKMAAAIAVDELTVDMCFTCRGAGQVRAQDEEREGRQPMMTCPSCQGERRWQYTPEQRQTALAREVAKSEGLDPLNPEIIASALEVVKTYPRLPQIYDAIELGKRVVLVAERTALMNVAAMVERWWDTKPNNEEEP